MNEKTKEVIDKLMNGYDKALRKETPATLTDVCRLLEMGNLTLITILNQLTEIREIMEKEGKNNEN